MKFIYIALWCFLLSSFPAHALGNNVEGLVWRNGTKLHIRLDQKRYAIVPKDSQVSKDISRLTSGDFLQGQGHINEATEELYLTSVHFVGLRQMLGTWRTEMWQLFEFSDFSRLKLYIPIVSDKDILFPVKEITYSVAPDSKSGWSILMSDRDSVDIGKLEISKTTLRIILLDEISGKPTQTIELEPL